MQSTFNTQIKNTFPIEADPFAKVGHLATDGTRPDVLKSEQGLCSLLISKHKI